jgi:hypothetical protein
MIVFRLAFSKSEPPAVIVDCNRDVIRIVEGGGAAVEGDVIEVPFGRSELPDQLRKIVAVFFIAGPATFGGKIELIPPLQLSLWRQ